MRRVTKYQTLDDTLHDSAREAKLAEALREVLRVLVTPDGFPDRDKGRTDEQQRVYDKARNALRSTGID